MKRIVACLVVVGFVASSAMGGTVAFDLVAEDLDLHIYDVWIASTDYEMFDTVDLLIGAEKPVGLDFVYDQDFFIGAEPPPHLPFMVYPADIFLGGFRYAGWSAPLLVGQLMVDSCCCIGG